MAKKITPKEFGYSVVIGVAAVFSASLIGGMIEGLHSLFATMLPLVNVSVGGALGAGVGAMLASLGIDKWGM